MSKIKNIQDVCALFVIVLVISLPFYSADALAATVYITKNTGEAGIPGFIDAENDIWTVEATISGVGNQTIDPSKVKMEIGSHQDDFDSCTNSPSGIVCKYNSPLNDGVREKSVPFRVNYYDSSVDPSGNSDTISADGSAPAITALDAKQVRNDIILEFNVNDKFTDKPSVGIKLIEIIDADNNEVLQSIPFAEPEVLSYNYADAGFENKLQVPFEGEGTRRIKIKAADWLGHTATGFPKSFSTDFVKPIIGDTFTMTVGKFIGTINVRSDITVQIKEKTLLKSVKAYSEQARLDGDEAVKTCKQLPEGNLWNCTWKDVEINPTSSIPIKIVAVDKDENTAEKIITHVFTTDNSAPEIEWFGPERTFEGIGYITRGSNTNKATDKVYLRVNEQGVGMSKNGIRANLAAVGGPESPSDCNQTQTTFDCYWNINPRLDSNAARISLTHLQDLVGNNGELPEVELVVDNDGPKIEKLELYGVDGENRKNYFQSNDQIGIEFTAFERSGLFILVDLNHVVMGAKDKFPEDYVLKGLPEKAGWQVFSQDECDPLEDDKWECNLLTEPIMSGPATATLQVRITDTAGNDVQKWTETEPKNIQSGNKGLYRISLLGLDTEDNPDYWEIARSFPRPLKPFVDLDTVQLGLTNMPFMVKLNSHNGRARVLNVELGGCVSTNPPPEEPSLPASAEALPEEGAESLPEGLEVPPAEAELPLVGSAVGSAEGYFIAETVPELSRNLFYGGNSPDGDSEPSSTLVLEFVPFDGKELFGINKEMEKFERIDAEYKCQLIIYSKVGNSAIQAAEIEEISLKVPFGYSKLGALDENLDQKIKQAKKSVDGAWKVIGTLNKVLKWIDYATGAIMAVLGVVNMFNLLSESFDSLEAIPIVGQATKAQRIAFCYGVNTFSSHWDFTLGKFQKVTQFLSCRPNANNWLGKWHDLILRIYNIEIGQKVTDSCIQDDQNLEACTFRPGRDIKDNFGLSVIGLCVPGLVKNLDEIRQIKCRKIYCLEEEVPANKATINSCEKLEGLLFCKYAMGELWYLIPFSQLWDQGIGFVRSAMNDPFALLHTATIIGCGIHCMNAVGGATLSSFCVRAYFVFKVIDFAEQIIGIVTAVKQEIESGGLQYCDMVGV